MAARCARSNVDLTGRDAGMDTPLARSLGYHLRQLSESFMVAMHREADARGVTISQWRYLRELWEDDGLLQRELSERVGRQGPTTVSALRSLQRSGYARVRRSKHDRRRSHVYLTDRGRELARDLAPVIERVEAIAIAGLGEAELAAFKRAVVAIQGNLDAHNHNRNAWARWRTQLYAAEIGASRHEASRSGPRQTREGKVGDTNRRAKKLGRAGTEDRALDHAALQG